MRLAMMTQREALEVLSALAKGAPGHRVTDDARDAAARLQKIVPVP